MDSQPLHLPVRAGGRAVVGIDVGKQHHAAVAINPHGDKIASVASFQNTREGIDLLQVRVFDPAGTSPQVLFAMEATGHYWMPLYHELVRRGYQGVVLNPIQTNGEARTRIRKTKKQRPTSMMPKESPASFSPARRKQPAFPTRRRWNCAYSPEDFCNSCK